MHPSTLAKRVQIFISVAFLAFYFYGLGYLPLVGPDEPRYAQVAREMLLRADWITPTLGGHTWFEKPALLYWLIIPAFKIFGVHEWSARLGPAICGLLTIMGVWYLAKTLERTTDTKGVSQWSLIIACACPGLIVFSRGVSFDIVVTATLTWTLCFFLRTQLTREHQNWSFVGFYVLIGLSLLAKGLVGVVIPIGVVGLYFLLRRAWPDRALWLSLLWGLPLSLVVSAVWYGPVIHRYGWQFIDEFFVQHHFARYLSNKYHHPQPFYFFPLILLVLTVPWAPFLIRALISAARPKTWLGEDATARSFAFFLSWIVVPVLFFSFSSSKLPGYILPVLPPALVLISTSITQPQHRNSSRWPDVTLGVLCAAMGALGVAYSIRMEHRSTICVVLGALTLLVSGTLAILRKGERRPMVLSVAGSLLVSVVIVLNCVAPAVSRRESTKELLVLADARGYGNLPVLALPGNDRSAQFYANRRVIYGENGEVVALDEAPAIVESVRKRKEKILAFIPVGNLELFRDKPGIEVVGDNGRLALLCLY